MRELIQGLAGSGKSYIVNAWTALAVSWGRDNAVQCVAITGIAASSLGGKTIASVLAMKKSFSAGMLGTKVLVIDEVRYVLCFTFTFLAARELKGYLGIPQSGRSRIWPFLFCFLSHKTASLDTTERFQE